MPIGKIIGWCEIVSFWPVGPVTEMDWKRYKYTYSCISMKREIPGGFNSQQIPTNNNIHKMLIIIISLRWKHFVIISYLYKIPTIDEP